MIGVIKKVSGSLETVKGVLEYRMENLGYKLSEEVNYENHIMLVFTPVGEVNNRSIAYVDIVKHKNNSWSTR